MYKSIRRPTLGINMLLVFVPVGTVLEMYQADPKFVFICSALAIIPLSKLIGESTEAISHYLGPAAGGLINASLGNAPEIVIGYFALKEGLVDMVKASITGAIIGNLLFGLGLTFLACAERKRYQYISFNIESFRVHSGLLMLSVFGLIIPAVFDLTTSVEREISFEISILLFFIYIMSVASTFLPKLPASDSGDPLEIIRIENDHEKKNPTWGRNKAFIILFLVTVTLAYMSEIMTGSVTPATASLGLSSMFAGVFVLALLGNVSELLNSIHFARNDQLELALGICLGGSAQMALMVAPSLVFLGIYQGQNMNLLFSQYELVSIIMTVTAVSSFLGSGRVRPRVGVIFITLYIMLGIGFFYVK